MLESKNMLMFVIMSVGLLSVLTGTAVSELQLVFAERNEECEDNHDDNCNEETQKIHQENNCKIVNTNKNEDNSDNNVNEGNDNGDLTCIIVAQNPENGDATVIIDLLPPHTQDPFALVLPF